MWSEGWFVVCCAEAHVMPVNDYRPHMTSRYCWCYPDESLRTDDIVLHKALDGREDYEHGRPLQ